MFVKNLVVNRCEKGAYNSKEIYDLKCFLDKNKVKNYFEYGTDFRIPLVKELVINSFFVFGNVDIVIDANEDIIYIYKNHTLVCEIENNNSIYLEITV